ncbi:unnamed protein product [Clonostachys byssicola]|uniref:AB hydrolase-1 domain-containing protein n=1 Tax=Clonostachys byssicola TaxID=160290 RepID=A0A9N9Y574_9HYPO|nr:unnamed protein product [Clonostachys byssicola]
MAADRALDPRVSHHEVAIRGRTYYYIVGTPTEACKDTVLLMHGFPDLGFGWRNQIPYLMSLGYRVIVPDSLGFGKTDAPIDPSSYTFKSVGDDIAQLVRGIVPTGKIILGGHDWGGTLVCRMAVWHKDLVKAVFAVGISYTPFLTKYVDLAELVESGAEPYSGYQLQFRGTRVEEEIKGKAGLRLFFSAMFWGKTQNGELGFSLTDGLLFDKLSSLNRPKILSVEEFEFYVNEYNRHGIHEPLNWYRNKRFNFDDEKILAETNSFAIDIPVLLVKPTGDGIITDKEMEGFHLQFSQLTIRMTDSTHWALVEASQEVNLYIGEFLETFEMLRP